MNGEATTTHPGTGAPGAGPETIAALRRLAAAAAVFALAAGATYLVPGLGRLRPWVPGDAVPLATLVTSLGAAELPAWAGAGGSYRPPDEALGAAVAASLADEDDAPAPAPAPRQAEGTAPPAVRIDPSEHAGIDVELERPDALEPFYRALLETAKGEAGALTRVAHYGDSSIATDLITHTVRRKMQRRFGDGGHGFVLVARGSMPYGHRDVRHRAGGDWELRQLVMNQDRDGHYGYGGVQFRGRSGPWAVFETDDRGPVGGAVSRFEVFYRQHPAGGHVRLTVDDGDPTVLDTEGPDEDGFHVVDVPDGPHQLGLKLVGHGQSRLYGVVLERDGPGVVYDSLGLVGARARRLLNFDRVHVARQIAHRDPALVVLGFGGNDADDPVIDPEHYEREFVQVIRRMRGPARTRACLVFSPVDQAQRDERGVVRTLETIPIILAAQKRAAAREGCAFWNAFEAMGGDGAMRRWVRARPPLAVPDYRHLTPEGYEVIGTLFYKALLRGFAGWLERHGD